MNRIIGITILILVFLAISSCDTSNEPYVYPTEYALEYQVTGTATRVNIEYQNLKGGYAKLMNVALPWNYQTHYYDSTVGTSVYLSAQNLDSVGNVTVTINAKGALYKQATTTDPYGFVAVYGALP
jgi:hypothetical protein